MAHDAQARKHGSARPVAEPRIAGRAREPRGQLAAVRTSNATIPAVRIFLSHSTKYQDLAKSLADALKGLQDQVPVEILLCEEMQGGSDWLEWINRELRSADILLLLYPHESMDMAWCSYEKGRFDRNDQGKRSVLCIKNVDIARPPPVFEQYQAYDADVAGIRKFLSELFAKGDFTEGRPLNAGVDQVMSEYCKRADAAATDLAQQFARVRVKDLLFERRLAITIASDDEGSLLDSATVQGNEGALGLFDMSPQSCIGWQGLRERLAEKMDWPRDLEKALPSIRSGLLPPSLSPFRASDGKIYLPVIPRTEMVAQKLRTIVVIFVAADSDNLRRMLDWLPPAAMPEGWIALVRLVKLMLRARWDVLEPRFQEARYRAPDTRRCAELRTAVLTDLERLSVDAQNQGFNGLARFRAVFDHALSPDLDRVSDEYLAALQALKVDTPTGATDLAAGLARLLANNAAWIQLVAKQFSLLSGELDSTVPEVPGTSEH